MYTITIDKEQINAMPMVAFEGRIVVIDAVSQVRAAVNALRTYPLVGFDTETRPAFKRGVLHPTALMQISAPDICFLFRINRIGLPQSLRSYIEDATCHKVGLSLHDDWSVLRRHYEVFPDGFDEIQDMVALNHIGEMSLQKIYAILFGQKISKSQRLTNWEADTLTHGQQRYAATDAWACINIYNRLTNGSFDPEQSPFRHEITNETH
ncbi:MAG: 3'-5' exonuclease domain-containing protein 2 [Muribaculaceae bacterium]|nr:3'-5' exonuclease domain-containing protein 2 [Muribaculaceae bacterium]